MSTTTSRSPDDLYDFSYLQDQDDDDRGPSPNTAALMAPVGNMTPAYVSRTRDGKPRLMDLNNLGLQKGAPHHSAGQEQSAFGRQIDSKTPTGQIKYPHDNPHNDRVTALQAESKVPVQVEIWKHEQRQRVEDAVNRIHQSYVSKARGSHMQPVSNPKPLVQDRYTDRTPEVIARPMEPVPPPNTPLGWEQDIATRTRRATYRIKQEYVDELRQEANYMDQLRWKSKIQEKLDEEKKQRERQSMRQQMFRSVPPDDFPARAQPNQHAPSGVPSWAPPDQRATPVVPSLTPPDQRATPVVPSWAIPDQRTPPVVRSRAPPDQWAPHIVPSWAQQELCAADANMQAQVPLTEKELDEKRRQLLIQKQSKTNNEQKGGKGKKRGKGGKRGSKKKSNENGISDVEYLIIPRSVMSVDHNEIVPRPPSHVAGSQGISHQPTAPTRGKENDGGFSKRKRRLLANGQTIVDNRGYVPSTSGMNDHGQSDMYYGTSPMEDRASEADVGNAPSLPRLIPRQTSQQTMCWNSETAKRGLGFKSRQTREAEQEAKSKSTEATKLSAEARSKWKRATLC